MNTENHSEQLHRIAGRSGLQLLLVGSNIERDHVGVAERKEREFGRFGLSFGRLQTLQSLGGRVAQWLRGGRTTRLHLIGPGDDQFAAEIARGELERRTAALANWYQGNADWAVVVRKLAKAWDAAPE